MKKLLFTLFCLITTSQAYEFNQQMQSYMDTLTQEAKKENPNFTSFDFTRGEKVFTTQISKNGTSMSCVTCHTNNLVTNGRNAKTNKLIEPLSPHANATRFTDVKSVTKWLRRNFRDVCGREGSAQEKGDVITYIVNSK